MPAVIVAYDRGAGPEAGCLPGTTPLCIPAFWPARSSFRAGPLV